MKEFAKDPGAKLDYKVDWGPYLGADTIQGTAVWLVPSGLTKVSESNTTTTHTIFISGGTAGATYTVTSQIVTAGGRIDERSFRLEVAEQ